MKAITDIEAIYQETYGGIVEAREACVSLFRENLQTNETIARLHRLNKKLGKPMWSLD